MAKKVVLLFGAADFAGSCWQTVQAINRVGRVEAHHAVLFSPSYGQKSEIFLPIFNRSKAEVAALQDTEEWIKLRGLIKTADLIHCWNNEGPDFSSWSHGLFPVPQEKVKSYSFTGTGYRVEHLEVNMRMKQYPISKIVVNHPMLRFLDEHEDTQFIPSAIDTNILKPIPAGERDPHTIGHYRSGKGPHAADIALVNQYISRECSQWRTVMGAPMSHDKRMNRLAKCRFYFEYLAPEIAYWGRSAIEAAALGIPFFGYMTPKSRELAMGRLGDDPPFIQTSRSNIFRVLEETLSMGDNEYEELSNRMREWAVQTYSYEVVGELWTQFFEDLL